MLEYGEWNQEHANTSYIMEDIPYYHQREIKWRSTHIPAKILFCGM